VTAPLSRPDVTALLLRWGNGDAEALERLLPLVYGELRALARGYLRRERPGHTLQPTALVHEAWLRLVDQASARPQTRSQFFAICARVMRQILVDHARRRGAAKRGGPAGHLSLDEAFTIAPGQEGPLVALDEALTELARVDGRQARVVELRFFGGLSIEETAEALALSTATVKREWSMARAWLHQQLRDRE
jgi:RNA polymerase sigma-70 factor, ECF subfamily